MEKAQQSNTRKSSGVRKVSTLAISTHTINEAISGILRPFSAKDIARRLRLPSTRTVENWKEGRTSPQAKHVAAMLSDDELCALLLAEVGQNEAAHAVKVRAARKKLNELEGK
jgi:DNA-binding transcriptional regulator YiaG